MASIRVTADNQTVLAMTIDKDVYVLGRQSSCDIHLSEPHVSRTHARLVKEEETFVIEDLGSSAGTRVNGTSIDRHVLSDGDRIAIDKFVIEFSERDVAPGSEVKASGAAPMELDMGSANLEELLGGGQLLSTLAVDPTVIRQRLAAAQAGAEVAAAEDRAKAADAAEPAPGAADIAARHPAEEPVIAVTEKAAARDLVGKETVASPPPVPPPAPKPAPPAADPVKVALQPDRLGSAASKSPAQGMFGADRPVPAEAAPPAANAASPRPEAPARTATAPAAAMAAEQPPAGPTLLEEKITAATGFSRKEIEVLVRLLWKGKALRLVLIFAGICFGLGVLLTLFLWALLSQLAG